MNDQITIALSKGRILEETLPLLDKIGICPEPGYKTNRKLILDTNHDNIKLVIIRATDVPTFVEYGAADMGVAGKDVLMEYEGDGLYEPLDLKISKCRLMVAEPVDAPVEFAHRRLRIATKYVNCANEYFTQLGRQVEIIKLYGSMELAPLVGLADAIVDLVDTGNTLKANGLVAKETVANISSRLVVNKASMKMKHDSIQSIIGRLKDVVESSD